MSDKNAQLEPTARPAPGRRRLLTRRRFLRALGAAAVAGGGTYLYASTIPPHALSIEHVTIPIPGLAAHRHGTRLVVLSDFHAGPRVSLAHLENALGRAAELRPDFLLIVGDFVDSTLAHLRPLCRLLAPIARGIPTYGSTGNHDFARDFSTLRFADTVCAALQEAGVHMLRNDFHQPLPPTRPGTPADPGELCFVGVEDLWSGHFDPATLARCPADASTIVLSHNPDSYDFLAAYRFHLMLAGHTHGGQVCIPLIGPILLPVQHRERAAGLFHLDSAQPQRALYVTRGVGHTLKVRLFCAPEITCLTLADGLVSVR